MSAYDDNPDLTQVGFTTPRAAAGLVIGSVVALWLLRRGFRGVSVGGVSVGVK